jgi:glycosyltransferase involved in cell wall biosynthesis
MKPARPRIRLLVTVSEFTYSSQVRNTCDLVSQLDREIFDVEIGALQVDDEARREIDALDVRYFKLRLQPTRPLRARDCATLAYSPLTLLRRRYDLVHSLLYQSIFTEAWLVKSIGGAKYVYTKSNLEWGNHPGQWQRKSALSDRIVSLSEATSALLAQHGFSDKTEKIYLGIDTGRFQSTTEKRERFRAGCSIPSGAFAFGCVAQFVEWKEHLTVAKAFEIVADRDPLAWLVVCGPHHNDSYYHQCMDYFRSSRHSSRIRVIGPQPDLTDLYSGVDVFVLASRFETFGYVYVESMSCSRPTIGCRAAGPLEIFEEERTGLFCEMSDPQDLSVQMARYSDSPGLAVIHGRAARERVKTLFSRETMAAKTQEMYLRVLGRV